MLVLLSAGALAATFAWGHYVEDHFWTKVIGICFLAVLAGSALS